MSNFEWIKLAFIYQSLRHNNKARKSFEIFYLQKYSDLYISEKPQRQQLKL